MHFRLGKLNGKADTLTWRLLDFLRRGDSRSHPIKALIPTEKFKLATMSTALVRFLVTSMRQDTAIWAALIKDPLAQEVLKVLPTNARKHKSVPLGECEDRDRLLLIRGLLSVPNDSDSQL